MLNYSGNNNDNNFSSSSNDYSQLSNNQQRGGQTSNTASVDSYHVNQWDRKKWSFQVLYTHQKTKKKKAWKDGRLILHNNGGSLYHASSSSSCGVGLSNGPAVLDTIELTSNQARAVVNGNLCELESEKFLIQVEGIWSDDLADTATKNNNQQRSGRNGMNKLLTNKFRMPSKFIPLHPDEKRKRMMMEMMQDDNNNNSVGFGGGKRRRVAPLQPGDLERQYYGDCNGGHHGGYSKGGNSQNGWNGDGRNDDGRGVGEGGYYHNSCNGSINMQSGRGRNNNNNNNWNNRQEGRHPQQQQQRSHFDNDYNDRPPSDANQRSNDDQHRYNCNNYRQRPMPLQYNNDHGNHVRRIQQLREDDFRSEGSYDQNPANLVRGGTDRGGRNSFHSDKNNNRPVPSTADRGLNRFRSNGYDPNGFYAEEDDDDDCNEGNDDYGNNGHGINGKDIEANQSGKNSQGRNNTYHEVASTMRYNIDQGTKQEKNSTPKDDHDEKVTNHLLTLLGAVPPSTAGGSKAAPQSNRTDDQDPIASIQDEEQYSSNKDDNYANNSNNGENSFMASIRQARAEEEHHQQHADDPVGYDWTANSDFEEEEEGDDDDCLGELNGNNFLNDIIGINSNPPTDVPKESISGFDLPSAGESSSSDESDDE